MLGGILARAARLHGVELFGFVVASNHLHLLCRSRDGHLSAFMQFVLSNAAKKMGPLVKWRGQLWERRFAAEPVLDDAAMEGRLRYILAHGVKEGLVRRASEWPGLSCLPQLLGPSTREFPFFEWTLRWKGRCLQPGTASPYDVCWATDEVLEVLPLPAWAGLTEEVRRAKVQCMIADIECEGRRKHRHVLGVLGVLSQDPQKPPKRTKRGPRPWCHASLLEAKLQFLKRYAAFCAAYREASAAFRRGNWSVVFPMFAFRPWVPIWI